MFAVAPIIVIAAVGGLIIGAVIAPDRARSRHDAGILAETDADVTDALRKLAGGAS